MSRNETYIEVIINYELGQNKKWINKKRIFAGVEQKLIQIIKRHPLTIKKLGQFDLGNYEGKNECVVCASVNKLTIHHIFPRCFLQFLDGGTLRDQVLVCLDCHNKYEFAAREFKNELYKQYSQCCSDKNLGVVLNCKLGRLVRRWRLHFLDFAKPKFMQKNFDLEFGLAHFKISEEKINKFNQKKLGKKKKKIFRKSSRKLKYHRL